MCFQKVTARLLNAKPCRRIKKNSYMADSAVIGYLERNFRIYVIKLTARVMPL